MFDPDPKTTVLIHSWQTGDRSALEGLLELHLPWLHGQLRHRMPDHLRARAESMDIVQESLREFLVHSPRFVVANGRQFRALLLQVAINSMKEESRRWMAARRDLARERPLPTDTVLDLAGDQNGPLEQMAQSETEAWVRLAIEMLDGDEQFVIHLRDFAGLGWAEVGERLGISEDAARMRHRRATAKLARILAKVRQGRIEDVLPPDSEAEEEDDDR